MSAERKIGVLIPEIVDYLEYSLLSGIFAQAKKLNCDVLVFTDTFNAINEIYHSDYIYGQENIYRLALEGSLDGIIFAAERFHNKEICNEIYERCKKLSVPCLVIEQENDILPYISAHQTKPIKELTEHLIHKHGCRRLYFLSGIEGHSISKQREKGFIEAMEENGLPADEDSIFYGDFWVDKPRQLGIDIASGKIPMPDAVVCASDTMAAAFCDALMENGVSVPDDVAVTGYDGSWASYMHDPRITTMIGREDELGCAAVCRLYEMMTGEKCKAPESKQILFPGTSCGCGICDVKFQRGDIFSLEQYVKKMMERYFARKNFMASDYISIMTEVETMEQLAERIYALLYTLHGVNYLEICLCEDWMFDFEDHDNYRRQGFSENMLLALSNRPQDTSSGTSVFPSRDIIPFLKQPHDPQLIVLTSLHHRDQVFGYTALTYTKVEDIFADAHYISWCDAVASGFDTLQKKQYNSYLRQQIESLSVVDPETGLYNKRGLMEHVSRVSVWNSRNDHGCICILISYVRKESRSVQHGSDPGLMIANALRLSSDDSELLCRLQDDTFAAILPAKYDDVQRSAEERIMRLEEKLRYVLGDVLQLRMPSLVTECRSLQFDKISQAETLISEMQQEIVQKAEAAAMATGGCKDAIYRMRREVFAKPEKEWSIAEAAGHIGISVSHFQRMYKSEFGTTFKEELITARIEKAKKLLRNTDLRVQEVADACGYNDYSHFIRQFKDKVGASALQYRKQKEMQ